MSLFRRLYRIARDASTLGLRTRKSSAGLMSETKQKEELPTLTNGRSDYLGSNPLLDGYHMPAEWELHER